MSRVILPAKPVNAIYRQTFDFISDLDVGETIGAGVCNVSVYSGSDSEPMSILDGPASVSGTKVIQPFAAGVLGTIYTVVCYANTSSGQTLILSGYLAIVPDVP